MRREELFRRYTEYLTLRNYSNGTKKSYSFALNHFLNYCQTHSGEHADIGSYARSYLVYRFDKGMSWRTVNIDYSSIRGLCEHVMGVSWDYAMIPRPKGESRLPSVLSSQQVERMINQTKNVKHKTILIILYTSGIRLSELLNLRIADILIDRHQIKVCQGKGRKDRIVNVPKVTFKMIEKYIKRYNPKKYLIEGSNGVKQYSGSSVRKIMQQTTNRAGIVMKVTTHSMRYAYATHHVESGTDLVTLQYQLGHKSIQTTINYVKLCQVQNRQLNHPIELLNIEGL